MIKLRIYWSAVIGIFTILSIAYALPAVAGNISIDQDTTIDDTNSFRTDHVSIVNGLSGSPTVTMAEGGEIGLSLGIFDNSKFIMTGGEIDFFTHVTDNATLVMKGGSIACRADICSVIDFDSILTAAGSATLHLFAGQFGSRIVLGDSSTAHFYGTSLELLSDNNNRPFVRGFNADGVAINVSVALRSPNAQIILHTIVPEPTSLLSTVMWMLWIVLLNPRVFCRHYF